MVLLGLPPWFELMADEAALIGGAPGAGRAVPRIAKLMEARLGGA